MVQPRLLPSQSMNKSGGLKIHNETDEKTFSVRLFFYSMTTYGPLSIYKYLDIQSISIKETRERGKYLDNWLVAVITTLVAHLR